MPSNHALRLLFKTAMFKIFHLGRIFGRQDESVLIAHKAGRSLFEAGTWKYAADIC